MTDLSPDATATLTCFNCGAQNAAGTVQCTSCGSTLTAPSGDTNREELKLDEVWRSAAAGGYDTDFAFDGDQVTCTSCSTRFGLSEGRGANRQGARDTPTNQDDLVVITMSCPNCSAMGRLQLDADTLGEDDAVHRADAGAPVETETESEIAHRGAYAPTGTTEDHPLGSDRQFMDDGGPGTLAERGSLLDEQGEDIRQYTGEPVETDEGWVIPVQQNVGPGNEAGGGEYPDPNQPPAMPKDDQPPPPPPRS